MSGLRFRRQYPVGSFVLDFACSPLRLGIELDGEIHAQQADQGAARTEILCQWGWRILRISNERVFTDLPPVIEEIAQACSMRSAEPPTG